MINADKPHLWKADITKSVDLFNSWFMEFAPIAYRSTRTATTEAVRDTLLHTSDLLKLTPEDIRARPSVIKVLRMATAPPLARDRLIGLAGTWGSLVSTMESGRLPPRLRGSDLEIHLQKICEVINKLLDTDIFPWLERGEPPSEVERYRASTIIADRLCGAVSEPIVRNAQERRQLALIEQYLQARGYTRKQHPQIQPLSLMEVGTFSFRLNVIVGRDRKINIPVDVVIQPRGANPGTLPLLMEAKSAGDFTNTNKRRKEEAMKIHQLRETYGSNVQLILFLCGYFDGGYLGYEAAEGLDWVWEHRIADLDQLGI